MNTEIIVGLFTLAGTFLGYLSNFAIERLKAQKEHNNYISKVQFDKEFIIYQELTEKNLAMVFNINELLLRLYNGYDSTNAEGTYHKAIDAYNNANFSVRKYAAFVPENICNCFIELGEMCRNVLYIVHKEEIESFWGSNNLSEKGNEKEDYEIYHNKISEKSNELVKKIRKHLSDIKVR